MTKPRIVLLLFLAACSPKIENDGYIEGKDVKSQIVAGKTTRDEVREKLGSPSVESSFGNETWYYISSTKETMAFFKPEITQQDVLRVEFDAAGTVTSVNHFDRATAQELEPIKRATPTEGHQLGFVEQLLGNIGRFNKPGNGALGHRRSGGY